MINRAIAIILCWSCFFIPGLFAQSQVQQVEKNNSQTELKTMLSAVQNNKIQFATMRPPGSPYAILERRIVVINPPELVELAGTGELQVLDELVKLLREPDRAWAAQVLLAAMTRREEKMVDSFATTPAKWWETVGKTAYERWDQWLKENREKLLWDSHNKVFVLRE